MVNVDSATDSKGEENDNTSKPGLSKINSCLLLLTRDTDNDKNWITNHSDVDRFGCSHFTRRLLKLPEIKPPTGALRNALEAAHRFIPVMFYVLCSMFNPPMAR